MGQRVANEFHRTLAMKLGVLRRLLCGGLLTEEVNARHRKHQDIPKCACGAVPTVLHISWCCPLHADVRDPCFTFLGHNGDCFPTSIRYATVVPIGSFVTLLQTEHVQKTLVTIWQRNIEAYHQKQAEDTQQPIETITVPSTAIAEYTSNGHQIAPRVGNPGVWCKKCGLCVARLKHVRLKGTGNPCKQANLPPSQWLTQEGYHRSESRITELEASLQQYNTDNHELTWNRKIGKVAGREDEGKIKCTKCGREWSWKHRNNNLKRSKCRPLHPATPASTVQARSSPESISPSYPAQPKFRPHRRLRTKTTPTVEIGLFDPPERSDTHEHPSAASSSSGHQRDPSLDWRRGEG